jgi:hypothetical protein
MTPRHRCCEYHPDHGFVEATIAGGLMSYAAAGVDFASWQRMVEYVDRIC